MSLGLPDSSELPLKPNYSRKLKNNNKIWHFLESFETSTFTSSVGLFCDFPNSGMSVDFNKVVYWISSVCLIIILSFFSEFYFGIEFSFSEAILKLKQRFNECLNDA